MSDVAPFNGFSPAQGGGSNNNNPASTHLRRVGAFKRGVVQQQAMMANFQALAVHNHGLTKDALSHESDLRKGEAQQAHEHNLATITHTSREQRRSAAAAVKNHVKLIEGLKGAGVDPSAAGVTKVSLEGVSIHTERPVTPARRPTTKAQSSPSAP